MPRLALVLCLFLIVPHARAQSPEEEWTERLTAVYTATDPEEALKRARALYRWVEDSPELQTYDKYVVLQVVFTQQAPDERLARKCTEQAQTLLAALVPAAAGGAQQTWQQEHYQSLFSTQDIRVVRRAERYLNEHSELRNYDNLTYVAFAYERVGDYPKARTVYEQAQAVMGDPAVMYQTLIYYTNFLTRTGEFLRARENIDVLEELAQSTGDYLQPAYYAEWLNTRAIYYLFTGDYFRYAEAAGMQYDYYRQLPNAGQLACDPYAHSALLTQAHAYEQLAAYDSAQLLWQQSDAAHQAWAECSRREPTIPEQQALRLLPLFEVKRGLRAPDPAANAAEIEAVHQYYRAFEDYFTVNLRYQYATHLAYLGAADYPERFEAVLEEMERNRDFTESTLPWAQYAYLRTRDGDLDEAWKTYQHLFDENLGWINDLIFTFGEQAFVAYFNVKLRQGYEAFHTLVRRAKAEDLRLYAQAVGQAFDNLLLTKSLAFKGSQRRKAAFLRSQNEEVRVLYEAWLIEKQSLVQLYQQQARAGTDTTQVLSPDSLRAMQDRVDRLENQLATEAEGFREQLQVQAPRWQELQRRLQPGEAAIEWVRFGWKDQALYSDSAYYAAYILRADAPRPEVVYLPTLAAELETSYYAGYQNSIRYQVTDRESYRRYWGPVAEALEGIDKVYVANDGVFHLVNLGTLYHPTTDRYLGETLQIQYVTSTANLLEEPPTRALRRAILLGRPAYEIGPGTEPETDSVRQRNFVANFRSLEVEDLPGTEDEVSALNSLLAERGVAVQTYLGSQATEEVLYQAEQPSIVHIATHGYWNTLDYRATEGFRAFNAMVNSGLLLSGVVDYYRAATPAYTHDGVLTAYEATTLSLEGTELVVLSACETGLGLLDAGEGVYGLQRAFRAAGAQSTLTSLWKVDDQATRDFMTAFYSAYLAGASKFEAWRTAQQQLRQQYPQPYYWGAFVLVN